MFFYNFCERLFQLCKEQYEFLMDIHKDLAAKESFVAVPEYWPIMKQQQRPQLVVQSAFETEPRKLGSAKYTTAIPHYRYTDYTDFPPFDSIAAAPRECWFSTITAR